MFAYLEGNTGNVVCFPNDKKEQLRRRTFEVGKIVVGKESAPLYIYFITLIFIKE